MCNSINLNFDRAAIQTGSQRDSFAAVAHRPVEFIPKGATVKEIPLTQGKTALVDDEDYERISAYKWLAARSRDMWYARRTAWAGRNKRVNVQMHRVVLGVHARVDHRDRNGLNNQKSNLRQCSNGQNMMNQHSRRGSSVFKGVHRSPWAWVAQIRLNKQTTYLGSFRDEVEAARAYDAAALRLFGEFARLNFPKENNVNTADSNSV